MTKIKVNYSIEYETQRIKYTMSKIDWYKQYGYALTFPESFSLDKSFSLEEEYIKKCVVSEYSDEKYKEIESEILEIWQDVEPKLSEGIKNLSAKLQKIYDIDLTKYGVGESYNLPNTIIINIQKCSEYGLGRTLVHEIIHLSIQHLIDKYKIEQRPKERIVDLIALKLFPELARMQNFLIDTKPIDEVFNKNYPNIEKVVKSLLV